MALPKFFTRWLEPIAMRALTADNELLRILSGGSTSYAGEDVNRTSALQTSAVFATVRVIAETLASLPCLTYERMGDGSRRRATEHPAYHLLHDAPNPEMTALQFFETETLHVCLRGAGYAEVQWNGLLKPAALWPLEPERVEMRREGDMGALYYEVATTGKPGTTRRAAEQMLHFRGMSWNGLVGYDPLTTMREAFGVAMAVNRTAGTFFANGMKPAHQIEVPRRLSRKARRRLELELKRKYGGSAKAGATVIMDGGAKLSALSVSPENAQLLATRRYSVIDIARLYRVPAHLVGEMEYATYANIEQQSLEFVTYTMRPYLRRFEQELNRRLFPGAQAGRFYAEFLVDDLLRGDVESRFRAFQIARGNGVMTANDWAAKENWPRIPAEQGGDAYMVPGNMIPADQFNAPKPQETRRAGAAADEPDEGARDRLPRAESRTSLRLRLGSMRPVLDGIAERVGRRTIERTEAALRKAAGNGGHEEWARSFYAPGGEFSRYAGAQMEPAAGSVAMLLAEEGVLPSEAMARAQAAAAAAVETIRQRGAVTITAGRPDWERDQLRRLAHETGTHRLVQAFESALDMIERGRE